MKNTDIMEALGDVPEDLVLSALHPADDLTAEPDGREQIIMTNDTENKGSLRRIWVRGGIAAAAVIALIAGNIAVLYSLGKIGRGGSSQTPLTSDTTDTTAVTSQQTDTTTENRKITVPDFVGKDYDEAVKIAESAGIFLVREDKDDKCPAGTIHSQNVEPGKTVDAKWPFITVYVSTCIHKLEFELRENGYCVTRCNTGDCMVTIPSRYNGQPVVEIASEVFGGSGTLDVTIPDSVKVIHDKAFWGTSENTRICGNEGSYAETFAKEHGIIFEVLDTIQDGEYNYRMIDNSLYRVEDNKKMFTVENPQAYLDEPAVDADSVIFNVNEIIDVGNSWYFLKCFVTDPLYDGNTQSPILWFNEKTGELKSIEAGTEEMETINALLGREDEPYESLGEVFDCYYCYFAPDGSALYTSVYNVIIRIPIPGNGTISAYRTEDVWAGVPFFAPIKDEKVLIASYHGLYEVNMADQKERFLTDQFKPLQIVSTENRVICLEGTRVLEYIPESNSFQKICEFRPNGYDYFLVDPIKGDNEVTVYPGYDGPEDDPDPPKSYTISLKDGKMKILK